MVDLRGPLPGGPANNASIPARMRVGDSNYDRVKDAISIVEYARQVVPEFSEASLRGRCPICSGGNASKFLVTPERRTGRCFDCDFRGSVIDMHAAIHGCEPKFSVIDLAKEYGVELRRGLSKNWHSGASARAGVKSEMEAAPVKLLAARLYRQHCLDYVRRLPDSTDDERRQKRKDANELYRTAKRQARALYHVGRAKEVSADAS